jgi:hypothetical protein
VLLEGCDSLTWPSTLLLLLLLFRPAAHLRLLPGLPLHRLLL